MKKWIYSALVGAGLTCGLLNAPQANAAITVTDAHYQAALAAINYASCNDVLGYQRQYNVYSVSFARNIAFAQATAYQGRLLDARETWMLNSLIDRAAARVQQCGGVVNP